MKLFALFIMLLTGCSSNETIKHEPTAAEQVTALQTMCKDATVAMKERQAKKSFYERLGGRKKITVFAGKIYEFHKANKQIGHMFAHTSKGPFVRNVAEFLIVGTGGKGKYAGRDMPSAHKNLDITNSDFLAAGGDVQKVMKELSYGENEIQEVVCALVSFVPVVIKN